MLNKNKDLILYSYMYDRYIYTLKSEVNFSKVCIGIILQSTRPSILYVSPKLFFLVITSKSIGLTSNRIEQHMNKTSFTEVMTMQS